MGILALFAGIATLAVIVGLVLRRRADPPVPAVVPAAPPAEARGDDAPLLPPGYRLPEKPSRDAAAGAYGAGSNGDGAGPSAGSGDGS